LVSHVEKKRKSTMTKTIFVFGSNTQGRHGAGAAWTAFRDHGAIYGQAEGLQGDSYAIITKELRGNHPKITLKDVKAGVKKFLDFAREHEELTFRLTPIGCGLAGFRAEQIAPLFENAPKNVVMPSEFLTVLTKGNERSCNFPKRSMPIVDSTGVPTTPSRSSKE
jgi:hypothetical protein